MGPMTDPITDVPLGGDVDSRFEPVREAFVEVLRSQPGTGASVAAWYDGRWVLDLHGGWADAAHTRPWTPETLVMPYSVTKPFAAMTVLVLAERGVLDLDAPVHDTWPELTARTTLREALAHRAGLVVLDEPAPVEAFYDWQLMCRLLEDQQPTWPPGTAQGEAALFYGHVLGEVVRRVDGRSLGQVLREEVCGPLGLDFHVGLGPGDLGRVADLTGFDEEFRRRGEQQAEIYRRALGNPPGALDPEVVNSERWRRAEIPALNGHGTARAVAGLYQAVATGRLLGDDMRRQLLTGQGEEPDLVIGDTREWGLGVVLDEDGYGMGGVGGSFGWWSEQGGYAFAFLTGHIGDHDRGDRLENTFREVLGLPPV